MLKCCVGTYVGSTALFKVSFLTLVDLLLLSDEGLNGGVDHVLDLALRHGLGTFSKVEAQLSLSGIGTIL